VAPGRAVTVAALYIDPRGPYPALSLKRYEQFALGATARFIDCWDASRDARLYDVEAERARQEKSR
jgi:hypothetical protein